MGESAAEEKRHIIDTSSCGTRAHHGYTVLRSKDTGIFTSEHPPAEQEHSLLIKERHDA